MKYVVGIIFSVPVVIGAIVLTNVIATRAAGLPPVGTWGAKSAA